MHGRTRFEDDDLDIYDDTTPLDANVDDEETRPEGGLHINSDQASASALEVVSEYYLNPDNLPALKSEKRKQIAMLAVALSGAPLYAIPADHYATRTFGDNLGLRINFIIGTCTPALVVLYNSTDIFLMIRANSRIPAALNQALKKTVSSHQNKIEDLLILTGSALSAMPLTVISMAYPIPSLPLPVVILMAAAVQFDNTVLHFLPIKLALSNSLYRLPFLPFELFYKRFFRPVPAEKTQHENKKQREKEVMYNENKGAFLKALGQVQKNIALNGFKFNFSKMQYQVVIPIEVLTVARDSNDYNLTKLRKIMTYTMTNKSKPVSQYEQPLRKFLYGVGAFWVISSCSGYLAATVTQLTALTRNLGAGIALSAPSVYFLTVLFAFFGGNALNGTYDYLTSWDEDDLKIPLEFKLYPKISAALMLFSVYLAAFSYAAADELIQDNYNEDEIDGLFSVLVWLAQTGIPFLSLTAMIAFSRSMLGKVALHYGEGDTKAVAELNGMLAGLQMGTGFVTGEEFTASLDNLTSEELKTFTGMTVEQLQDSKTELSHIDDEPDTDISRSPRGAYSSLDSQGSVSSIGMFGGSPPSATQADSVLTDQRSLDLENDYNPAGNRM
jgi:hypothetical protein